MDNDVRWVQRFENFEKALIKLEEGINQIKSFTKLNTKIATDMMKESLIKRFEYTHELAWKVMQDFLKNYGQIKIYGSKDATREAFTAELISDGHIWMDMILSRNLTVHTYDENTSEEIYNKIIKEYYSAFIQFKNKMQELKLKETK